MSEGNKPEVMLIDFNSIKLVGDDAHPEIVAIRPEDGFFINERFSKDFRIRKSVYERMKAAQKHLPDNYCFMLYEAYRPLARQVALWNEADALLRKQYPDANEQEIRELTETFVADPFNGIGSGHQACCAIDISLCDGNGREYDMGCECQEFCDFTATASKGLSAEAIKNRMILKDALEKENLINYPAEWWHFSYGDHQWAYLLGKTEAFYGPLDLDSDVPVPVKAKAMACEV